MHWRTMVSVAATAVGVTAALRQRREAAQVRAGDLRPLGPDGRAEHESLAGSLHRAVRTWQPARPRSRIGRAAAAAWAGPLTALGLVVAATGGNRPRWDPLHGALVVPAVRGPARWFLTTQSANAATLGQVIVLRDPSADARLLAHEAVHARQQERLGPLFAAAYPVASALWGYRRNPFEVAARAGARALNDPSGSA